MFCYQCEQTAKGQCCTVNGVCGKSGSLPDVNALRFNKILQILQGVLGPGF